MMASPTTALPFGEAGGDDLFLRDVKTLIGSSDCTQTAQNFLNVPSWRFRNRDQVRLTRRLASVGSNGSDDDPNNVERCVCCVSWFSFFSFFLSPRRRRQPPFGFPMMTGTGRFFQRVIQEHPLVAVCMWLFFFVCETIIVVLYIYQTWGPRSVIDLMYRDPGNSYIFYTNTVLSIVLLSQLVFASSTTFFTILVVLATSIYQITCFCIAVGTSAHWVSRLYVPLFLRCWPLRQYLLFLLDSLAILSPQNHRFDVFRHAAPQLTFFLTMTFTCACIFQIHQSFRNSFLNIGEATYWVVVTVSTVGFGDIVAHGLDGRALAMIMIFLFLAMMPTWILLVSSTARILREFPTYTSGGKHFLVYGHVNYEDALSILEEVLTLHPLKTVCFCFTSFAPDVLAIGRHPRYRLRSSFLRVRDLDRRTLKRIRVSEATAIIIFPSKDSSCTMRDADVMLWSVLFQRHAPHVPQYLLLRFGVHAKLLRERQNTLVDQSMRVIMATALLLPGVVPFLVNLIRTASAGGTSSSTLWDESEMDNWRGLYEYSRRNVFGSCPVPWFFVRLPLCRIVRLMKLHDVLVVGVEEGSRRLMRLDMEYCVEACDTLLVLHERGSNSVHKALQALEPRDGSTGFAVAANVSGSAGNMNSVNCLPYATSFASRSAVGSRQDLFDMDTNTPKAETEEKLLFYPFRGTFDLRHTVPGDLPQRATLGGARGRREGRGKDAMLFEIPQTYRGQKHSEEQVENLRQQLLQEPFVNKTPRGVPLSELPLGNSLVVLEKLLKHHRMASADSSDVNTSVERLEQQINHIINHVAEEHLSGTDNEEHVEEFLFIDQVSSFVKPTAHSFYEEHLSRAISRYELLQMMQGITAIYTNSRLTLLSPQKFDTNFLRWWYASFKFPLRHICGMSSIDAHLNYTLQETGGIHKLRGILLYCSQLGAWEFADVPLITVKNNIQALLEWAGSHRGEEPGREQGGTTSHAAEQNVLVELQSFASCVFVTPHHTDKEWRRRGEEHFQDSLAFMMGRCFSENMLETIFIHAHHDPRILQFFEMVLRVKHHGDCFDIGAWAAFKKSSSTLFQFCGNQLLHFSTFGDAFFYLLSCHSWVTIGVFRQFPASEGLPGVPRYFITNPPLKMPLRDDDVMYALSCSSNMGSTWDT